MKEDAKFYVLPAVLPGMNGFSTLKKAVRHVLEAEQYADLSDEPYDPPKREILDENGDAVEVDWDADEYKTKEQLAKERDRAKASTISAVDGRLRAEKALLVHQKQLIDAGLIPAELLTDFMVDMHLKAEPMFEEPLIWNAAIIQSPQRVTVDMRFQMAAPGTAAHYALNKLINHKR